MSDPSKKPRLRNVAFHTTATIQRRLRAEADRQAERLGLGGAELRGHKFLLNRLVREFLDVDESERDRRVDVGIAIERAESRAPSAGPVLPGKPPVGHSSVRLPPLDLPEGPSELVHRDRREDEQPAPKRHRSPRPKRGVRRKD